MPRFGRLLFLMCALAAAACAGTKVKPSDSPDGGAPGAAAWGARSAAAAAPVPAAARSSRSAATPAPAGRTCTPSATCTPPGGRYCGVIGNGCPGMKLDCGTCTGDSTCENLQCVGGPSCTPLTCGNYCGEIGDGCGRKLTCTHVRGGPGVPRRDLRRSGLRPAHLRRRQQRALLRHASVTAAAARSTAAPARTAAPAAAPATTPNVCNDPTCQKISCTPMGGQYCGTIGNGCGGTQDCGACANGMACPTTGASAHICPGSTTTVPPTCTGATKTTISGVVYDPAGVNPLYNVIVYVPSGPLPSLANGVSCDRCGAQVNAPLRVRADRHAGALHDDARAGAVTTNVPLVMQVGKWRRQITIPTHPDLHEQRAHRQEPDAAAAHPGRGEHPEDRGDHGRRRRARVPAPPHRHRRHRVRDRRRAPGASTSTRAATARNSFMAGGTFARRDDALVERDQARELRHRDAVVRGEHQQVRRHEAAGEHRQRRQLRQRRAAACSSATCTSTGCR